MFKVFIKQEGEGCDYTIACGETVIELKATTLWEAIKEFQDIAERDYYSQDRRLKEAKIYDISRTEAINMPALYSLIDDIRDRREKQKDRDKKRALYEQLKQEFDPE